MPLPSGIVADVSADYSVLALADHTTVTTQMTGATCAGGAFTRKFAKNRGRRQAVVVDAVDDTVTITAPAVNRNNFAFYLVINPDDPASTQQVYARLAGGSVLLQQANSGGIGNVLIGFGAGTGPSTLFIPHHQCVGQGRAMVVAFSASTDGSYRMGVMGAVQSFTGHSLPASAMGDIAMFDFGGFKFAGEFYRALIYAAHDAATMAATMQALIAYYPLNPRDLATYAGTSIQNGFGASGASTYPHTQAARLLGPDWWLANIAVGGRTLTDMIAGDGALLDAVTARPGYSTVERKHYVVFDGATNEIYSLGASGELSYQRVVTYINNVLTPRGLLPVPTTTISRNDGETNAAQRAIHDAALRAGAPLIANGLLSDRARIEVMGAPEAYRDTTWFADGVHPTDAGHGANVATDAGLLVTAVGDAIQTMPVDVNVVSATAGALTAAAFAEPVPANVTQVNGIAEGAYATGADSLRNYVASAQGSALSTASDIIQLVTNGGAPVSLELVGAYLKGAAIYRPGTGETRYVTEVSHSGSVWTLSLDTPFDTAMTLGEVVRVFVDPNVPVLRVAQSLAGQ